ncbi:branched-chain amino acid ABC transporter ATP-binding protein/permease [Microbacterium sp. BR1]|uniref:branched-chain amino acid ABC transporter ATP-binding protein/permease n=1 Tax=Microbacterium sp. BR1 TaxID=1070896 RepID=UPI000C2CDA26|nr:branched-chain amino acid ABC transporter ATP-binding protein/permease [Microbacterium sp. BR1]
MDLSYLADLGIQMLFIVALTAALNLLMGTAGQMSMATAGFYAFGAYAYSMTAGSGESLLGTPIVGLSWPPLVAVLIAGVVTGLAGALISLPVIRRIKGDYIVLLTLAFFYLVLSSIGSFPAITGGTTGTVVPPIEIGDLNGSDPEIAFIPVLVIVGLVILLCSVLARSPFGRVLRGMRDDDGVLESLGRYTGRKKIVTFALTSAIMGVVGAISASYFQFVAPTSYTFDLSVLVAAAVALGGPGNILGGTVAAIAISSITPLLQNVAGMTSDAAAPWRGVIYGALLIVGIRFRPRGLFPERMPRVRPDASELDSRIDDTLKRSRDGSAPDPILTVRGLSKRFAGLKAVSDVSFDLHAGQVVALIGPNGAGKTTIFNMLTGVLKADEGEVTLRGAPITGLAPQRIVDLGVGRYFQSVRLFPSLTAYENVALGLPVSVGESATQVVLRPLRTRRTEKARQRRARELLRDVGVEELLSQPVTSMSYGDQKVVALARLLATDCEVLLLDEPTSGVDPKSTERLIKLVRNVANAGKAICLVEHSAHVVSSLSDQVVFLEQGSVIATGTIDELMAQADLVERYFGS